MKLIYKYILLANLVSLLAGIALTSCSSQSTPTINPNVGSDAKTSVVNALFALTNHSYRMDVISVMTAGETTTRTMVEFIPPDKKHILDLGAGKEFIIIGKNVYEKDSSTAAWTVSQEPATTFMGDTSATAEAITANLNNVKVVRTDSMDGKPVTVYSYDSTSSAQGTTLQSQTQLWVGDADGLPIKMLIAGDILASSTDPLTGYTQKGIAQAQTTTLFTFNTALDIEAPIK